MAIKFEKITAGMTLYDRHRYTMGRTSMKSIGEWRVIVQSVDAELQCAEVSWNHNPVETWGRRRLERLYTWSMHDPGVHVKKGFVGNVYSVSKNGAKP